MAQVFDAEGLTPTQKLVMLSLADHANEDGRSIYPSVKRICSKTALKERAVRRTLSELRDKDGLGLIRITSVSTLAHPNEYAINIKALKALVVPPASNAPPALNAAPPALNAEPPALSAPKPPVNHHEPPRARRNVGPKTPTPSERDDLFDAIVNICGVDLSIEGAGKKVGKVATALKQADPPYTDEDVQAFGTWWWSWKERTTAPSVWKLQDSISQVRAEPRATTPSPRLPDGV